jgi:hypothetical protein
MKVKQLKGEEVYVERIEQSIKGEQPFSGCPTVTITLPSSNALHVRKYRKMNWIDLRGQLASSIDHRTLLFTGEPFDQLEHVSLLIPFLGVTNFSLIVETSGKFSPATPEERDLPRRLISNVDALVLRISSWNLGKREDYAWLNFSELRNGLATWDGHIKDKIYYKFVWNKTASDTSKLISTFFTLINKNIKDYLLPIRILVLCSDVNNKKECKEVWDFCSKNGFGYTANEYLRLTDSNHPLRR